MKKGQEIKQMISDIQEDHINKRDYLVDLHSLKVKESFSVFPNLENNTGAFCYNLTDHSLNQLSGKLEIGTQYINKCLPVSQKLVADNLNFWISERKNRDLMVRTYQSETKNYVRAVMTNRYKIVDAHHIMEPILNKVMDLGAEFKYSYYDGDKLNITVLLPKLEGEVEKDDIVQAGITITNSEIGNGGLLVQPFVYRLVCTNGMVAPRYLNRFFTRHVGKIVIDLENDEQWITIIDKMQKQIELVSNPEVFQENLQKLKQATTEKITSHKIVELTKRQGLSELETKEVFQRLDHYIGDTFTTSKYNVANAITNIANDEDISHQRARFLQELGGLVIFANNPMQVLI